MFASASRHHCCRAKFALVNLCGLALLLVTSAANALVVLQYHHIDDDTPAATSTSPELFRQHMDYLQEQEFNVIPITELHELLASGSELPDKTAVITFDDGYRSIYTYAYPLLKRKGFPFTVFINTQPHDEKNSAYIQWDELREMAENGVTIGNHTDSHPHLIRRGDRSEREWRDWREQQILHAEKRIEAEIGETAKVFAYPFGEYDDALQRLLEEHGYLAFGQQSGPVYKNSDPQVLPRFPFGGPYGTMQDFKTKVWSLPFPVSQMQVTDEKGRPLENPELPEGVDRPILKIVSPVARHLQNVQCFASGQGRIDVDVQSSTIITQAGSPLPTGRSRYNCTAQAGGGRFYWYSQLFIRRLSDGRWYAE